MAWVVEHIRDLDADFRVFYRFPERADAPGIADGYFGDFSAPHFFRLAYRTFAYKGVMQSRAMKYYAEEEERKRNNGSAPGPQAPKLQQNQGMKWDRKKKLHEQPAQEVSLNKLRALDPTLIEYERG